ncbi:bacillithiol system redox-active protein YtxJ [Formosa sp. PL04]|uniref:bacillithiol system redox-active protein YtxJ n=1 Tax=Formosa sp. PL04 TaxID=3081755 RepID=UPI002981CAD6|nr:bacillithiol system redox-active protein YtxJ [Formosa sp. PL04]MDW5289391.1 bacillithiol system redox-active protein YtxJ [Formosa sp. PL04]
MGFFDKIFSSNSSGEKEESAIAWKALADVDQLDAIVEASKGKAQAIFKHSTRCGISRMVLSQFEKSFKAETQIDMYFLDLLQHRDISNEIANRFNVHHESPQFLIIKNGEVVKFASHSDINSLDLLAF